jgi:hypothetical protein
MSYPIAGNQNFTKVENLAGQLSLAKIGEAKVNKLQANSVASSVSMLLPSSADVKTLNVVAPTAFATLAAGATLPVVLAGNTATPTASTDAANATLPEGSVIVAVEFSNNGVTVAGTSDLDLGIAGFNTGSNNLVKTTTATIVNDGGLVQSASGTTNGFGSTGAKDEGVVVLASPNNFLTLTNNTGANTTGAFAATVYYLEQ